MRKFPFLRRPVRLILYAVLMALLTTAALIFAWQYELDGIALEHSIDTYAYVGTLVHDQGKLLDKDKLDPGGTDYLRAIPEELVQAVYDCEYVTRIDNRQTLAGVVGEYRRTKAAVGSSGQTVGVPDSVMGASAGNQYIFLEGTVHMADYWGEEGEETQNDNYNIKVNKVWNDEHFVYDAVTVHLYRHSSETPLEEGQRVFLVTYSSNGQTLYIDTAKYYEANGWEGPPVSKYSYTVIPEGVDSEAYIREYLDTTGLGAMLDRQLKTRYAVTIRVTQDMMMIPMVAKDRIRTYEGRVLTTSDMGKKVCVISSGLSQRNRLSVGDTIQLSLADGCYGVPGTSEFSGWETGIPIEGEALLETGEYEEYEIVGIYSQIARDDENALFFSTMDIFIPADEDTRAVTPRSNTFSFRVPGPDYVDFLAEFEPIAAEAGWELVFEDAGWDDVKESYYTMLNRRTLMLWCALAAFAAAVAAFAVLLCAHSRYEYGLRRLMGATKIGAGGIYLSTFLFTGLPAAAAAVYAAWLVYVHRLKDAMTGNVAALLPSDGQCAVILATWAALALAVSFAVLIVLALREERRGLLRLIRR